MAEKEERIVCRIIEKGYGCDYCFSRPAHNYYQCSISNNDCTYDMCKQCSLGMTRQEAIKKISSHLLMCDISTMDTDEIAEAALNALLEGK